VLSFPIPSNAAYSVSETKIKELNIHHKKRTTAQRYINLSNKQTHATLSTKYNTNKTKFVQTNNTQITQ
jgi:hypothetical protein